MLRPRRKDGAMYVAVEPGTKEAAQAPVFILVKDRAGGGTRGPSMDRQKSLH